SGGALQIPDDTARAPVIDTTLRVWDTTTDPASILVTSDRMFVVQEEGALAVIESVTIGNLDTEEAYIGRGEGGGRSGASVGFSLPATAENEAVAVIDSDVNLPQLLRTEYGFATTVAIPPGETKITFSYRVPGAGGTYDLSRKALYPIVGLSVFAEDPLDVTGNRLESRGEEEVGGRTYSEWTVPDGLDAADSLQIAVVADAGVPAGLLAGMGGVLLLVLALGLWPVLRSRRKEEDPAGEQRDPRDLLLEDIATLDLQHEQGAIERDEWSRRRAELKDRLVAATKERHDA
ncbi:MAG TPA: hypothetical protein VFS18_01070, partial [Actinomycetota bacterium]|nr:hypothetical protein [Actinomycetota bacterium]